MVVETYRGVGVLLLLIDDMMIIAEGVPVMARRVGDAIIIILARGTAAVTMAEAEDLDMGEIGTTAKMIREEIGIEIEKTIKMTNLL